MSFLFATPESVTAAASQITTIGSALEQANTAVKASTATVLAAGADEVSTAIATLMSTHGQAYQTASAQVSQFHNQFIQLLNASAGSYATAEAANGNLKHPRFHAHLVTCDRCALRPGVERSTLPRLRPVGCGPGGA